MSASIYIEGGGDSKYLRTRCREGFSKLLKRCGFSGRLPRTIACGSRGDAFDSFKTACHTAPEGRYVALLVDSEDPVTDIEQPWTHLSDRDRWSKPPGAHDEQVLLMVTSMETWIIADRSTLRSHYGPDLRESALPAPDNLESRDRRSIQDALSSATRNCGNAYRKGKRSFEIVGKLNPDVLAEYLPSFARCKRLLAAKL